MMDNETFRRQAHQLVDWMADYLKNIEQLPVKSQSKPYEVFRRLPDLPPGQADDFEGIMEDFREIILPGMTHWQHPKFFAYFPANSSYASVLGEMLTATLGAQCMIWETSPAAAELEEKMMNWLREMLDLPRDWDGVIQDTASAATLSAILSAREKATNFSANHRGFPQGRYRIYCSSQTHSSIDKAVRIAGLGSDNLVKVGVDDTLAMNPAALSRAIEADMAAGLHPLCVIATLGTTGTTAIDPLEEIGRICTRHKVWLHVDAAYAGTALILPEYRHMARGMERVDSFVFNPHKWMFTNFDCSAYFVRDKETLIRTFEILPEYLKTATRGAVNDYRDWGVALGRRFRALKLWFVIRDFGVEGLRKRLREHIRLAHNLAKEIEAADDFEIMAPGPFNALFFRWHPREITETDRLNALNAALLGELNNSGKLYLTHTKINDQYIIRMVIGQTYVRERHVQQAWEIIRQTANSLRERL